MNLLGLGRIIAIVGGVAVLFGLKQGLEVQTYVAVAAGILFYGVVRLAFEFFVARATPK